jgi:hypothetical protein
MRTPWNRDRAGVHTWPEVDHEGHIREVRGDRSPSMYTVNTCMLPVARYATVTHVLTMTNVHYSYNNRCLFSQVKNKP